MTALVEAVVPVVPLVWRVGTLRLMLVSLFSNVGYDVFLEKNLFADVGYTIKIAFAFYNYYEIVVEG